LALGAFSVRRWWDNFPLSSVTGWDDFYRWECGLVIGRLLGRDSGDRYIWRSILGPDACIVIDPFEGANTAGTALYNSSIALEIGILNSSGLGWNSVDFQLYTDDACTDVSPDTDQWSFAPERAVGPSAQTTRIGLSVASTLTAIDGIDRMEFELDTPLADGAALAARFTLTNGSALGTINPPFSMRIIPEPSAMVLLGLGVLGFFFRRRRA
jgi:hypothetical protein